MAGWATLVRHPVAIAGALLTTVSAALFLALLAAVLAGLFQNPYAGLLVFVAVPALFIFGLLLIPFGMWLERRAARRGATGQRDWPVIDFRQPAARRWTLAVVVFTAINLVIVLVAAQGTLHTMDSPAFCGQTCHVPMEPQYVAWQYAPHSNVTCTECHVGEGARALVRSKLAGVRQLYHVATDQVPRPITGVTHMRPAIEICGSCHWPERDFGEPIRVFREYANDEANSETVTRLQMLTGGVSRPTSAGRAIHWHADPRVRVEFVATDNQRQTIKFVRVTDSSGTVKEFRGDGVTDQDIAGGVWRVMDCVDCHSRPAHRISPTAEQAIDAAIAAGDISPSLPFVRREGVRLVGAGYPTKDEGLQAIERELRAFYTGADDRDVVRAIASIQNVYRRNVFPSMKVTFGTYPDNSGHTTSNGCFRCHDDTFTAADGTTISGDCEYCHKDVQ